MTLDEQIRTALDQEARTRQAPAPDANRLISGGKVRRRRHNLVRLSVASAFAVVLVGGSVFAAQQMATSTDSGPARPPSATAPQALFTENLNLEPGTYRMVVGVDMTGVEIAADLTFRGPDWISGPYPTVVADNGAHEYTARGGVGVYPPEGIGRRVRLQQRRSRTRPAPPKPLPSSWLSSHGARSFCHPDRCRRSATTPSICACGSINSAPQARATSSRRRLEEVAASPTATIRSLSTSGSWT